MAPINIREFKNVVQKKQADKSPGPDGLPIEFLRGFRDLLCLNIVELSRTEGRIHRAGFQRDFYSNYSQGKLPYLFG